MEIRLVKKEDAEAFNLYYSENVGHFKPWEPERAEGYDSVESWQERVIEYVLQQENHQAAYFIAIDNGKIVGHCNLSQIVFGPFQACYMGYGVAKSAEGKGIAFGLCEHVIAYAFEELRLHRIMANYIPSNARSARLLSRLGFVKEGLAKDYLKIDGRWQDHVLTSLTNHTST